MDSAEVGEVLDKLRWLGSGPDRSPVIEWAAPPGSTREIIATELRRKGQATAAHLETVVGRS